MTRHVILAAATAAAIAGSAVLPTGAAFAAPAPVVHKPLLCLFFPTMDVCVPPKPVAHHYHKTMMMKKKP